MRKTNVVKKLVAAACTGAMVLSFIPSSAFAHSWGTDMGGGSFGGESYSFADSAPSDRGAYDFAPSNNAAEAAASYTDYSFNMESYSSSDMQESIRSSAVSAQYSAAEESSNQLSGSENRQTQDVQTHQEADMHAVLITENAETRNPAEEGSVPAGALENSSADMLIAVPADSEEVADGQTAPVAEEPSVQDAGEEEQASSSETVEESHTEQTEAADPVVSESAPATEESVPQESAENGSAAISLPEETASSSEEMAIVNSEETNAPVAEAADSVAEAVAPVAEAADPVAEAADPVAEAADPVAEAAAPVAETASPVGSVTVPESSTNTATRTTGSGETGVASPVIPDGYAMQESARSSSLSTEDFGGKQVLSADNAVKDVRDTEPAASSPVREEYTPGLSEQSSSDIILQQEQEGTLLETSGHALENTVSDFFAEKAPLEITEMNTVAEAENTVAQNRGEVFNAAVEAVGFHSEVEPIMEPASAVETVSVAEIEPVTESVSVLETAGTAESTSVFKAASFLDYALDTPAEEKMSLQSEESVPVRPLEPKTEGSVSVISVVQPMQAAVTEISSEKSSPSLFPASAKTLFTAAKNTIREFFGLKVEYNEEEVEIVADNDKEEITLSGKTGTTEKTNVTVSNGNEDSPATGSIYVASTNIILTLKNLVAKAVNSTAVSFAQPEKEDERASYSVVIEGDVDLSSKQTAIEVKGGVDLDISGASGKDGDDSLTVTGTGKHGAGIGFYNKVDDAGNITIHDLHEVNATGGTNDEGGVGIGGGRRENEENGQIVLEDIGSVTAVGGGKAAAIGAGFWRGVDIVISRVDEVIATGGKTAAAIGSSRNAIQGDEANPDNPALVTNIHITDSNITAVGGENGAAIGTGYSDRVYGDYSRVDQNKATGEKILGSDVTLPKTTIVIDGNSVIEATGGKYAAAIGGGYKVSSPDITIGAGTTVTAYAGSSGGDTAKASSAIGSGADGSSIYSSKDAVITIEEGASVRAFANGFELIFNQTDAKKSALGNRWAIAREAADNSSAAILQGRFLKADQLGEEGKAEAGEMSFYTEKGTEADRTLTIVNLSDSSEEILTIPAEYTGFALSLDPGSYQILLDGEPLSYLEAEGWQAVTEGNTPEGAAVPYKAQTVYGDDTVEEGSYVDYTHIYNPYGSSSDAVDLHYAYGVPSANFNVEAGINSFDAVAVRSNTLPFGNVTVRYLDEDGSVLHDAYVSEDLHLGSEFDVTLEDKLDIEGYEYSHTDGNLSGTLRHNHIVTVYYNAVPAAEPVEEPGAEPVEEPVAEPAAEPKEEPAAEPVPEPAEGPVEEPAEEPVEEPAAEPAAEPAEEPAAEPVAEPAEEAAEESVDEPAEEQAVAPVGKPDPSLPAYDSVLFADSPLAAAPGITIADFGTPLGVPGAFNNLGNCFE